VRRIQQRELANSKKALFKDAQTQAEPAQVTSLRHQPALVMSFSDSGPVRTGVFLAVLVSSSWFQDHGWGLYSSCCEGLDGGICR
jgi:hypothetical protein